MPSEAEPRNMAANRSVAACLWGNHNMAVSGMARMAAKVCWALRRMCVLMSHQLCDIFVSLLCSFPVSLVCFTLVAFWALLWHVHALV